MEETEAEMMHTMYSCCTFCSWMGGGVGAEKQGAACEYLALLTTRVWGKVFSGHVEMGEIIVSTAE